MTRLFFETPADFRAWLEAHHDSETELLVGFYKKGSGKASITYPESVEQALCFGRIDGVRRTVDSESYEMRFTPRRPGSFWSRVNIARMQGLIEAGLAHPAGLAAFARRTAERSGAYSFEQDELPQLTPDYKSEFEANTEAWDYFQRQAPWYRRTAIFWVMDAKREETRRKRLDTLIQCSAEGRTVPPLTRPTGRRGS